MFFCMGFCYFAVTVHIVPLVTDLEISATTAANILAVTGGASIIGRVGFGSIGDRIGNRQAFIIGFALMSLALLWLVPSREAWQLYLFALIFGMAYGDCATQESPLVAGLFGLSSHGLIFGAVATGFTIGAAMGPYITGYVFDVTDSYKIAFLTSAAIGFAGLIFTILLPSKKRKIREVQG
jgi:MFS family permease